MLLGAHTELKDLIALRFPAARINRLWQTPAYQTGERISKLPGRGMEFAETRAYVPGDDVRTIDWRVTARTGEAHTKVFNEEKDRQVLVLLDQSPALFFGSRKRLKSVACAELATLILWTAFQHNCKAGGLLLGKNRLLNIKPAKSRTHLLQFIRRINDCNRSLTSPYKTEDQPDLIKALDQMRYLSQGRSLLFILSDFQVLNSQPKQVQQKLAYLGKKYNTVCILIFDPLEVSLPKQGLYGMTDGQYRHSVDMAHSQNRAHYEGQLRERQTILAELCSKHSLRYLPVATTEDATAVLSHWLSYK